jgi:hypothetical protein
MDPRCYSVGNINSNASNPLNNVIRPEYTIATYTSIWLISSMDMLENCSQLNQECKIRVVRPAARCYDKHTKVKGKRSPNDMLLTRVLGAYHMNSSLAVILTGLEFASEGQLITLSTRDSDTTTCDCCYPTCILSRCGVRLILGGH